MNSYGTKPSKIQPRNVEKSAAICAEWPRLVDSAFSVFSILPILPFVWVTNQPQRQTSSGFFLFRPFHQPLNQNSRDLYIKLSKLLFFHPFTSCLDGEPTLDVEQPRFVYSALWIVLFPPMFLPFWVDESLVQNQIQSKKQNMTIELLIVFPFLPKIPILPSANVTFHLPQTAFCSEKSQRLV